SAEIASSSPSARLPATSPTTRFPLTAGSTSGACQSACTLAPVDVSGGSPAVELGRANESRLVARTSVTGGDALVQAVRQRAATTAAPTPATRRRRTASSEPTQGMCRDYS